MQSEPKNIPENANQGCPGALSQQAGKGSACDGCPNQSLCSSGAARKEDPAIEEVKQKMSNVKKIILILSGKGGVGKSTISSQLAWALSQDEDTQVGLLDVDICGPSVPRLMGLEKHEVHQNNMGWEPVYIDDNLGVMSIGFMLPSRDDAVIWRGPRKNGLIKQFLTDVVWGELDYLIIDTPPGTSDQHISIAQYLKKAPVSGAVVVTTPQEVALLDVRKELNFCKKTGIPILGVVENMSGFKCPHCDKVTDVFVATTGGAKKMCEQFECPFLGKVPLDPKLLMSCEGGKSFVATNPESPTSQAIQEVAAFLAKV